MKKMKNIAIIIAIISLLVFLTNKIITKPSPKGKTMEYLLSFIHYDTYERGKGLFGANSLNYKDDALELSVFASYNFEPVINHRSVYIRVYQNEVLKEIELEEILGNYWDVVEAEGIDEKNKQEIKNLVLVAYDKLPKKKFARLF